MSRIIISILIVMLGACSLVKEEKYIATDSYRDATNKLCLEGKKYQAKSPQERQAICRKESVDFITSAENKFREYKADEHNYRLCRSKYADIQDSDKCFREQQDKYYARELEAYKASLQ